MFKTRRVWSAILILGMIFGSLTKAPVAYADSTVPETAATETAESTEAIANEIDEILTEGM